MTRLLYTSPLQLRWGHFAAHSFCLYLPLSIQHTHCLYFKYIYLAHRLWHILTHTHTRAQANTYIRSRSHTDKHILLLSHTHTLTHTHTHSLSQTQAHIIVDINWWTGNNKTLLHAARCLWCGYKKKVTPAYFTSCFRNANNSGKQLRYQGSVSW